MDTLTTFATCTRPHVRWMIRRDMVEVLSIDAAGSAPAMGEDAILSNLRQRNTIGMVVEVGEKIVGFMIYRLEKRRLDLVRLHVHPDHRRQGIASIMLNKLIGKLSEHRRVAIVADVPEECLDVQLFFKATAVRATGVHAPEGVTCYKFKYQIK